MDTIKKLLLFFVLLVFSYGCGKKGEMLVSGLTDVNATAIVFSSDGEVVDFVHIEPGSEIDRIEFLAPDNGDQIRVVLVGPAVSKDIPSGMVVSSKVAEGYAGKVIVDVENDVVILVTGNGVGGDSPLQIEHLEQVKMGLQSGIRKPHKSTLIIKENRYLSGLVKDVDGNLVPSEMSQAEKKFLENVVPAFRKGDIQTLSSWIHKDASDASGLESVKGFLEFILRNDIKHFRLMKFDPIHPDSKRQLFDMSGNKLRHSLPVEMVLTVYFTTAGSPVEQSANLLVGLDGEALKFITTYAL